ncbi:MAG: hypothetical protein JSW00_04525 [Thermoplasmata archaeon]|nr:MAG: hypothetical protein JSW00_04525 [Thermoplasmata archaeon]
MMTTIAVSDKTRKDIQIMKIEEGYNSVDDLIKELIIEHKKSKFQKASKTFRRKMKEKKLKLEDLIN